MTVILIEQDYYFIINTLPYSNTKIEFSLDNSIITLTIVNNKIIIKSF